LFIIVNFVFLRDISSLYVELIFKYTKKKLTPHPRKSNE